ncbi:MAG: sugar phosphate isomerase/epimerase [Planctomycetota bacterium]|nr:MAG: sugar phosphate isomerase/epimerase [Planctomycetota bacterium]
MIKTSATITMIPELKGGPFLFADDLEQSCRKAAGAGFDAVELVIPSVDSVDPENMQDILSKYNLQLAAVSSGGGYLVHKLHLGHPDADRRRQAMQYISHVIDLAGPFGAVVIIGVMKGYVGQDVDQASAWAYLAEALEALAPQAEKYNTCLVLEALNRYESNFVNRLQEGIELIESLKTGGVKLLADLFHMNIEERSIGDALRQADRHIGHVHFADSNRRAAGFGHIDFTEVGSALRDIDYDAYVSAEIFPYPDEATASEKTLAAFRKYVLQA